MNLDGGTSYVNQAEGGYHVITLGWSNVQTGGWVNQQNQHGLAIIAVPCGNFSVVADTFEFLEVLDAMLAGAAHSKGFVALDPLASAITDTDCTTVVTTSSKAAEAQGLGG